VAAKLREDAGTEVELKRGGFGELRVSVDGRDVYVGHRLGYTTPGRVIRAVREAMVSPSAP
jgi:hypothetical protein